ncbi:MAG: DNA-binding protein [Cellulomonas sp.]|uniref:hypothetical protein n=1 Tax=Cellulomonas sp. TaxID=40001 RepID=UPI0017CF9616|nr:hypothetical protein [Cellulomonas sp.]NMM32188.1 DNA-binding protein [Cellulomonas sp.]
MSDPLPERTFSPEEVAKTLGTSAWWVREQARAGRAEHLRVGKGRIRFTAAQVATLVERATVREDTSRAERQPVPVDASVLGATVRSLGAHRSPRSPAASSGEAR